MSYNTHGGFVCGNKLVHAAWQQKLDIEQKQRLAYISARIDNTPPTLFGDQFQNQKKKEVYATWCRKVDKENKLLLQRMYKIQQAANPFLRDENPQRLHLISLNSRTRHLNQLKIERENHIKEQRLSNLHAYYNRKVWEKHEELHKRALKNLKEKTPTKLGLGKIFRRLPHINEILPSKKSKSSKLKTISKSASTPLIKAVQIHHKRDKHNDIGSDEEYQPNHEHKELVHEGLYLKGRFCLITVDSCNYTPSTSDKKDSSSVNNTFITDVDTNGNEEKKHSAENNNNSTVPVGRSYLFRLFDLDTAKHQHCYISCEDSVVKSIESSGNNDNVAIVNKLILHLEFNEAGVLQFSTSVSTEKQDDDNTDNTVETVPITSRLDYAELEKSESQAKLNKIKQKLHHITDEKENHNHHSSSPNINTASPAKSVRSVTNKSPSNMAHSQSSKSFHHIKNPYFPHSPLAVPVASVRSPNSGQRKLQKDWIDISHKEFKPTTTSPSPKTKKTGITTSSHTTTTTAGTMNNHTTNKKEEESKHEDNEEILEESTMSATAPNDNNHILNAAKVNSNIVELSSERPGTTVSRPGTSSGKPQQINKPADAKADSKDNTNGNNSPALTASTPKAATATEDANKASIASDSKPISNPTSNIASTASSPINSVTSTALGTVAPNNTASVTASAANPTNTNSPTVNSPTASSQPNTNAAAAVPSNKDNNVVAVTDSKQANNVSVVSTTNTQANTTASNLSTTASVPEKKK